MKEKEVTWDNLHENKEVEIEGVLDAEFDGECHVITSEDEFQELIKALHE